MTAAHPAPRPARARLRRRPERLPRRRRRAGRGPADPRPRAQPVREPAHRGPVRGDRPRGRGGAAPGARRRRRARRALPHPARLPVAPRSRARATGTPARWPRTPTARRKDPRAIAYLGELNLGASAVSVPVTNKAGLLQVSPADGLASLTEAPPRSAAGPERYYPSGQPLLPAARARRPRRGPPDRRSHGGARGGAPGPDRRHRGLRARAGRRGGRRGARRAASRRSTTKDLRDDPDTVLDAAERAGRGAARRPAGRRRAGPRPRPLHRPAARRPDGARLPQASLLTGDGVLVGQPLVAAAGSEPAPLEAIAPQPPRGPPARPAGGCSTASRATRAPSSPLPRRCGATSRCGSCSTRSAPRSATAGPPTART